jgi:putative hydrolase of the HAD superfamily
MRRGLERLEVAAVTFDFGNTLVRVDHAGLRGVVRETAQVLRERRIAADEAAFLAAWDEERARQFREELPQLREVNLPERVVRVLARLRGYGPPPATVAWDDRAATRLVDPAEIEAAIDAYSWAFVARIAPVPDAGAVLERLAGAGFALGILSNWPLAVTIDRYAESRDWLPHLRAIVVSQRVGVIKPHPAIFEHAREQLRAPAERILHVGDDWAADVVGARQAGWRVAYLRDRQGDTPLPTSTPPSGVPEPGDAETLPDGVAGAEGARGGSTAAGVDGADLVLDELSDLEPHLVRWTASVA